ncbi:MAG: hypothetical protein HQL77_03920 [Magnetococcales bacterium]|nr:hypothetical protein [Magnetococcales bacterium]
MEVIMVILVIGIMASSITGLVPDQVARASYTRSLASDIRRAQALAMSQGGGFRILSTSSNSYEIRDATGAAVTGTKVTLADMVVSSFNILFDRFGTPTSGAATVTLTDAFGSNTVSVSLNTGAVS